jgi:MFS family permease
MLALLIVINLINYIDRYNLAAIETQVRDRFFAPNDPYAKFWTGSLAMAFMVSYMVFAPLFGWLADRMSRWILIGVGVGLWSLATGMGGLADVVFPSFWVLFAARCLVGVGEGAYGPAAPAVIADTYPVARRGTVMAWFYAAIPVGSALGYAIGGFIGKHFGWPMAFYAMVPPGLALAAICFFMRDPPRGQADLSAAAPPRKPTWDDYKVVLRTPSYVLATLGMTAMSFAVGGVAYWMPTYVYEYRYGKAGIEQDEAAMIFGGITVVAGLMSTILGGLAGDWLRRYYGGAYFLVSGLGMLAGFGFFLAMLFVPFPYAWGAAFLAIFCLFFNTGPANTILANVVHPSVRGSAIALNIFVIHAFGDAFSPALIGLVSGLTGSMNVGFLVVSGMILVSGVLWLWGCKYLERDTALAPTRLALRPLDRPL